MQINVRTVLDQAEKRKKEEKPLPRIKIKASEDKPGTSETSPKSVGVAGGPTYADYEQLMEDVGDKCRIQPDRQALIDELQADLVRVKKERAVLSSQNWRLVDAIEAR